MKKNKKDQEQKRQPRRLSLNRETIRSLDDRAVLGFAKGGVAEPTCPDQSSLVISGDGSC